MTTKQKVLICGGVRGKFKSLFARVCAINEKAGPFDMLLCVGEFFGDSPASWVPYKNGLSKVPIPTYILGPCKQINEQYFTTSSGDLCENLSYLGKRGIFTTCGLRIAYLSGLEGTKSSAHEFCEKDAIAVRDIALRNAAFIGVDILLTTEWPKGMKAGESKGSELVSWLACQLKPRYHFCAHHDTFYERAPYMNHSLLGESVSHCTRVIALADVTNASKQKWLYAANLLPIDVMKKTELYLATADQTECPYPKVLATFSRSTDSNEMQYFFENEKDGKRKLSQSPVSGGKQNKKFAVDAETCWFCLASPVVQKHLVVSVGTEVYLAMARGGLTELHVMILPIQHHQCLVTASASMRREIKLFKAALNKFFATKDLVPVIFERNYKTSHLQLQVVPVAAHTPVKEAFVSGADEHALGLMEIPHHSKLKDIVQPSTPYFYVELPSKERLFCSCKKNFPLSFGRDVLASKDILNIPEKIDWRECIQPKNKEESIALAFRSEFQPFDFTL